MNEFGAEALLCRLLTFCWEPQSPSLPDLLPWREMLSAAGRAGVLPMVHLAVQTAGIQVPESTSTTLAESYYQSAAIGTIRLADLQRMLEAFSGLGVIVMVLKGADLAESLYGNVALRLFGDLDILVDRECLPACRQRLLDHGFTPTEAEVRPGFHLEYRSQQGFWPSPPYASYTELHWHLIEVPFYLKKLSLEWFWRNSSLVALAGHQVRTLNPTANLLYLSAHLAFHHRFQGLRWFLDLALLVHHHGNSFDWADIGLQAQRMELLLALRETVRRVAHRWPSLALADPLAALHELEPTAVEQRLYRLLTTEPRSPLLDFYTDLYSMPSWGRRFRFAWLNLFPQRSYMYSRYGQSQPWLLPAWYLRRLGDGVLKAMRTVPQVVRLARVA